MMAISALMINCLTPISNLNRLNYKSYWFSGFQHPASTVFYHYGFPSEVRAPLTLPLVCVRVKNIYYWWVYICVHLLHVFNILRRYPIGTRCGACGATFAATIGHPSSPNDLRSFFSWNHQVFLDSPGWLFELPKKINQIFKGLSYLKDFYPWDEGSRGANICTWSAPLCCYCLPSTSYMS